MNDPYNADQIQNLKAQIKPNKDVLKGVFYCPECNRKDKFITNATPIHRDEIRVLFTCLTCQKETAITLRNP